MLLSVRPHFGKEGDGKDRWPSLHHIGVQLLGWALVLLRGGNPASTTPDACERT